MHAIQTVRPAMEQLIMSVYLAKNRPTSMVTNAMDVLVAAFLVQGRLRINALHVIQHSTLRIQQTNALHVIKCALIVMVQTLINALYVGQPFSLKILINAVNVMMMLLVA
jgi:hypothetical protein